MVPQESQAPATDQTVKHVCGRCNDEWLTEEEYCNHVCPATSKQPTDPAHLGPEFAAVQQAALERGLEKIHPADQEAVAKQQDAIQQVAPVAPEVPAAPAVAPPVAPPPTA